MPNILIKKVTHAISLAALVAACVAIVLVLGWALYQYIYYIDETVTEGDAYGLTIGSTKRETYSNIGRVFQRISPDNPRVFILRQVSEETSTWALARPGRHLFVETPLEAGWFSELEHEDVWEFYIGPSFINSLTLKFCEERLCEIHRHRKAFELP